MQIGSATARTATSVTVALGCLLALALVAPAPAGAADNGEWSAFPGTASGNHAAEDEYFHLDVAPGERVADTIVVRNRTGEPLPLTVHGADAYNTPQGGAFALTTLEDETTGVGSWITVGTPEVVVPAATRDASGEQVPGQVEVPFVLHVPDDATPGDHAGGLVTVDLRPRNDPSSPTDRFAVRQANGVRVYVRVWGRLEPGITVSDVHLSEVRAATLPVLGGRGRAVVELTVTNSGNVRVSPEGEIVVTGLLGGELERLDPLVVPELLPGERMTLRRPVGSIPALDRVTARVELRVDGEDAAATGEAARVAVSPTLVALTLVAVAGLGWGVHRLARRRLSRSAEPSGPAAAPPPPQPGA